MHFNRVHLCQEPLTQSEQPMDQFILDRFLSTFFLSKWKLCFVYEGIQMEIETLFIGQKYGFQV